MSLPSRSTGVRVGFIVEGPDFERADTCLLPWSTQTQPAITPASIELLLGRQGLGAARRPRVCMCAASGLDRACAQAPGFALT